MWMLGALAGGAAAYLIDPWMAGVIAGGVLGWIVGRLRARPDPAGQAELERRLDLLHSRLAAVEDSLGATVSEPEPTAAASRLPESPPPVMAPVAPPAPIDDT